MTAKKSKKITKTTKPKKNDVPLKGEEEIVESGEVKSEEKRVEEKSENESETKEESGDGDFTRGADGVDEDIVEPKEEEEPKKSLEEIPEPEKKEEVEEESVVDEEEGLEKEKEATGEEELETEEKKPKEEDSVSGSEPEVGEETSSELDSETNSVPKSEPELSEETSKRLENDEAEEVPLEKKNTVLLTIGSVVGAVVITSSVWLLYVRSGVSTDSSVEEVVVQVVEPTESAVPSPSPSLKRSEISIEVLNGSGVSGAAAANAETFEELGYEIFDIGNADDTEGNELYIDESLEEQLDKLMEDVLEELDIASISGYIEDSTVSARIILGS